MALHPRWIALGAMVGAPCLAQAGGADRLAPGYAQMMELSAEPEISSATYEFRGGAVPYSVRVTRIPYESKVTDLGGGWALRGRLSAGYLKATTVFNTNPGTVATRWRTFSLTGGLGLEKALGSGWTAGLGLEGGLARLDNHAVYKGDAEVFQPILDGVLFNWQVPAWLFIPSLGVRWIEEGRLGKLRAKARVSRATVSTFHAPDPGLRFREASNAFSLSGELVTDTGWRVAGAPVDRVLLGGTSGFFGANRDALGFTSVSELGGGLQVRLPGRLGGLGKVRLSGSWLAGPGLRGWTFGLGLAD